MGTKRILLCLVSALVLVSWVAPPTQAEVPRPRQLLKSLVEDPEFPAEWAGIWNITTTERECGSSTIADMYTEPDTICTGETFSEEEEGMSITCDGTITSTSIDVTCGASVTEGGCTITISSSVSATRSGETLSGTGQYSITYTGCGGFFEDECFDEVYSGVRTGPEPPECGLVPVLPTTWGVLKSRYSAE